MENTDQKTQIQKLIPMDMKPAKILLAYDELIKQPGLYILRMIRDKYSDKFSSYIDTEVLKNVLDKDLEVLYNAREERNPLKWVAISEFDYDLNYKSLYNRDKDMYTNMKGTDMFNHVKEFNRAFFITDIFIWTRLYDKRVDIDIALSFGTSGSDDKFKYVTGPFDKVVDTVEPNMVFYPFIDDDIWKIIRSHKDTIFALPNYTMNRGINNTFKGQKDDDYNVGFYPIMTIDSSYCLG